MPVLQGCCSHHGNSILSAILRFLWLTNFSKMECYKKHVWMPRNFKLTQPLNLNPITSVLGELDTTIFLCLAAEPSNSSGKRILTGQ